MKYFIWCVVAVVVAVIGAGFFFVGTPAQERLRRFDETRVNDLSMTQSDVIAYWQAKKKLPSALGDLADATRGIAVRHDPVTNVEYGYQQVGDLSFRLCADFSTVTTADNKSTAPVMPYNQYGIRNGDNWNHTVGTVCFDRTIDPDFFKTVSVKN